MYLFVSSDRGVPWSDPRTIAPAGSGQIDVQIKVDPVDGSTVYASWLQNNKSLIAVPKSVDFRETWKTVIANRTEDGTAKNILVVKGKDVYVGYNPPQTAW